MSAVGDERGNLRSFHLPPTSFYTMMILQALTLATAIASTTSFATQAAFVGKTATSTR